MRLEITEDKREQKPQLQQIKNYRQLTLHGQNTQQLNAAARLLQKCKINTQLLTHNDRTARLHSCDLLSKGFTLPKAL